VRAEATVQGSHPRDTQTAAGVEPSLTELIAELACAGLISLEAIDDGDVSYSLTPQGQVAARMMAMCRQPHALVLLGALVSAGEERN
jgi:hypothetical protein